VPPDDTEALVKALEYFVELPAEEMQAYHQRARARYEETCHPDIVGQQVSEMYRTVLRGASGMGPTVHCPHQTLQHPHQSTTPGFPV